jgi:hypothetical protein
MRRLILLAVVTLMTMGSTGCIINQYDPDPNIRMQQLLNQSENLRQIRGEWHRFWMNDQPSHLTPQRVNGLISP